MDSDCPGLIQPLGYDHGAVGAGETGDLDQIETVVRPVKVSCQIEL